MGKETSSGYELTSDDRMVSLSWMSIRQEQHQGSKLQVDPLLRCAADAIKKNVEERLGHVTDGSTSS